jgi:hypothetical protein
LCPCRGKHEEARRIAPGLLLERQDRRMDRGVGVGEMDPLLLRLVNRLS